jgi:hypothetical protein
MANFFRMLWQYMSGVTTNKHPRQIAQGNAFQTWPPPFDAQGTHTFLSAFDLEAGKSMERKGSNSIPNKA